MTFTVSANEIILSLVILLLLLVIVLFINKIKLEKTRCNRLEMDLRQLELAASMAENGRVLQEFEQSIKNKDKL